MTFTVINRRTWKREEVFSHYIKQKTSFSLTTELEVDVLYKRVKQKGYTFYPAFLYLVTSVVNKHVAFRMSFNQEGELGYWSQLEPVYTIFHEKTKLFSGIWTSMNRDFNHFHTSYLQDVMTYQGSKALFPKKHMPENTVSVSMIPWTSFTGFHLMIQQDTNYLLPIVTAGKLIEKNQTLYLPVSLQVHHAVCDGYHASMFMNDCQQLANQAHEWIK
ncbi:type A chloramphenicol O-acetyltransferase [Shouchella lehensis]|uniref:Chloramphenicol acetyltransferase n=1 Tax=Shouchella lehensis TaxID=300825 RepID=A0A4Y7WLR2_9BACI|nr:type A chloramphenicol O-acetyltransferase [Shouchella lehensis]MBG9783380.1 chloramphenicol acetyltransferase [Shouchella lehensis]TES49234.1 type A chloramphenicol O-acetyltransferase [Shouchella lehensis]